MPLSIFITATFQTAIIDAMKLILHFDRLK